MVGLFKKGASKKNAKTPDVGADDAKGHLMTAARQLFGQRGFDGVTVRDIADAAGVNLSLVSYHFGGKEGLYRYCLEEFGKARLSATERFLTPPESKAEFKLRFTLFVEEFYDGYKKDPDAALMINRECEAQLPIVADIFQKTFFRVFLTLRDFFIVAHEKGFLAPDIDPLFATQNVMGILAHSVRMDPIGKRFLQKTLLDDQYRKEFCQHVIRFVCDGLLAKGESHS